uniref:C2H2-type domain-containing protein n=1 Tax=Marseillevirus LCMAC101 TaxID=2506602 RepID=A0A481YSP7_9VIRU|nr:MAG: hypothetical protein LCMAC101_06840 [Marseillevirus LCMAC101]
MSNVCDFCGRDYSNKYNLVRHQKTYCKNADVSINTKKYDCKYCNNYFSSKNSLGRHKITCPCKNEYRLKRTNRNLKIAYDEEIAGLHQTIEEFRQAIKEKDEEFRQAIKEKDEEIVELKVKCETGKIEVYDKVCIKALDKSTVTNNTNNTAYIHPKLVNLPITNIHPLTEGYVKDKVSNGGYTFDHYLKGENGLVDFIYSITMCENDDGDLERNYVCTDPSRDSYHRLVETKEWRKDKGGKFVDVILDTLSDKADGYHMKLLDERNSTLKSGGKRPKGLGYDPDYIYKVNTDMHSGIVQPQGKNRKILRQKIKKETSRKISV